MGIFTFITKFIKTFKDIYVTPGRPPMSDWESMVHSTAEEREMKIDYDARVPMRHGVTAEAIVSFILKSARETPDFKYIEQRLRQDFHLQEREAIRAMDRTLAGVVHAATGDPQWCPDSVTDPIAWQSYQIAITDRSIIQAIYPDELDRPADS